MRLARSLLLLVLTASVLGACGSDDPPTEDASSDPTTSSTTSLPTDAEPALRDALAAYFQRSGEEDPNALQFDAAAADCMADGLLEGLGAERLQELGLDASGDAEPELSSPSLDDDEATLLYDLTEECTDLRQQVAESFEASGLDPATAECVAREYAESGLLAAAITSGEYDPELNDRIDAALDAAVAACDTDA